MYRPQFPMPDPPAGFVWQPCIYQFDPTNLPALGGLTLVPLAETGYIPLKLDHDAPFRLLAVRVSNAGVRIQLFDPWTNQLMDDYVEPPLYATDIVPVTVLEGPGIDVPAGAVFTVRLQGE